MFFANLSPTPIHPVVGSPRTTAGENAGLQPIQRGVRYYYYNNKQPQICWLNMTTILCCSQILWVRSLKGYNKNSLSLLHNVWALNWEDSKAGDWNHLEAPSVTCLGVAVGCWLLAGTSAGPPEWNTNTWACPCVLGLLTA